MIYSNYGYDLAKDFGKTNQSPLILPKSLEEPDDCFKIITGNNGERLYRPKEISFVNTSEFVSTGKYFEKHGIYTKAHPIHDKYAYKEFWNEEERRRKEGMVAYGELYKDDAGEYKLRKIHITGQHYGYLNYARINRVPDADINEGVEQVVKDTKAAKKDVAFPDFWDSDYFYFKAVEKAKREAKHLIVSKARRKGYSYKNGWICADRVDLYPNTVTAMAAYESSSLYPAGTFNMSNQYLQFLFDNTDWKKRRDRDAENFIRFGYRLKNSPAVLRGYKSTLLAESFSKNPGVLRGKDGDLIIVEEAGKARNLKEFLNSTLPTLMAGMYVTGTMIIFGTGGGDENYWEDFEDLFYDPDSQDFLMFENIFDEDSEGEPAGFFVPDYANKEGFMDYWGNSNVKEATRYEIDVKRKKLKEKGKIEELSQRSMEHCFSPSEAFARGSDNIFPKDLISEHLNNIRRDSLIKSLRREGEVLFEDGNYKFKDYNLMDDDTNRHPAINDLRLNTSKDNTGCFVQFFPPFKVNGVVPENLYRIWHDPFASDKEKKELTSKHSFGCTYVYERVNTVTPSKGGRLMGVYIGRPNSTDAYNDKMYRIAKYYNAQVMYEKNMGTVYTYFRQLQELDMLSDTPSNIFDKETGGGITNRNVSKGIHINVDKKRNGAIYLKDWLLRKIDKDENGEWKLNLHYIYDENLLKELLKWNMKGNFDRVSTMILGMYDIEEQFFVEIDNPAPRTEYSDSLFEREWF